jgi:hypothetical protein
VIVSLLNQVNVEGDRGSEHVFSLPMPSPPLKETVAFRRRDDRGSVPSVFLFDGILLSVAFRPIRKTVEKLLLKLAPFAESVKSPIIAAQEAKKIDRPYASHRLGVEYV